MTVTEATQAELAPPPAPTIEELDAEVADLETVIGFLEQQIGHFRYLLGGLLQDVYGADRCFKGTSGDFSRFATETLYPRQMKDAPLGCREGPYVAWSRPKRRWSSYTRKELLEFAKARGVKRPGISQFSRGLIVKVLREVGAVGNVRVG